LARKKSQINRGKNPSIGRGIVREKFQNPRPEAGIYRSHIERGGSSQGRHYGERTSFSKGIRRGRGGEVKCYTYGKTGHMSW
jgi:hypothetical protein